jgi:hypothetical protein
MFLGTRAVTDDEEPAPPGALVEHRVAHNIFARLEEMLVHEGENGN